jgi:hypothetical protein
MPPQMKQDIKNMQAFQEKNGYIKKVNQYVPVLLGMKRESEKTLRESAKNKSPYDTSLKQNLSDIKLSFIFKGDNAIDKAVIIGYGAGGSYKEGNPEGWDGISVFFTADKIGTCVYRYHHIVGAVVVKNYSKYIVNNKPGNATVEGTMQSGFDYGIDWFTNNTMSTLECANMKFDKEIMPRIIALAKKIDAAQDQKS